MRNKSSFNWAVCYLLVFVSCVDFFVVNVRSEEHRSRSSVFFYSSRLLHDGEHQKVIHFGGVTVKETSALVPSHSLRQGDDSSNASSTGIRLVQVTDGRHLIQAIFYADYKIKDCEYLRDKEAVKNYLNSLKPDFEAASQLDDSLNEHGEERNVTYDGVINLKVLHHASDLFPESRRLIDYKWIRAECRTLHKKMKELMRETKKNGDKGLSRKKRELFIYPGTNWCGVGAATEGFNDLGWNAAADRCCRQHDHCPYIIESFTKKYNMFNYRFHTLSHCECDERFRTCLKMVNNAPSNLVGKLFFNVVQMKCFVMKTEKRCIKKTWWGRCLKYDKNIQAYEKDVLTY